MSSQPARPIDPSAKRMDAAAPKRFILLAPDPHRQTGGPPAALPLAHHATVRRRPSRFIHLVKKNNDLRERAETFGRVFAQLCGESAAPAGGARSQDCAATA